MKALPVAMVLASAVFALSGALFFFRSMDGGRGQPRSSLAEAQEAGSGLAAKLEGVLDRLDRLEGALSRLELAEARSRAAGAESAADDQAVPPAEKGAEEGSAPRETRNALAAAMGKEADELRSFVHQVIQDEREERRLADIRRVEERQRELEALNQGPYGQFNYRVNSLAKKLNLSDFQKQRYHALISDYSGRIEAIRQNLDRNDQTAYQAYRGRKQAIMEEFDGLVIQSLTPPQLQTYQELPSHERSPAQEHAAGGGGPTMAISTADGKIEAVMGGYIRASEMPVPFIKSAGDVLWESPRPSPAALPAHPPAGSPPR